MLKAVGEYAQGQYFCPCACLFTRLTTDQYPR